MPSVGGSFTLGDLLTIMGGIITATVAVVKILLSIRDTLKDLQVAIGGVEPVREGLMGRVENLKDDVEKIATEQQEHRDWLIAMGQDRRVKERREKDLFRAKKGI